MSTQQVLSSKAVDEVITAFVDYSPIATSISSATVTVTVFGGTPDANPSAIKVGEPTVNGTMVSQKIQGGIPGCKYSLRFLALLPSGDRYGQTLILTVTA